jgi:hypothetical protein
MLKSSSDYRERSVTVVSHFLGGSAPDLVTGVVVCSDARRGGNWCGEGSREGEKRRGRSSSRNLAPSDRISRRSGFGYQIATLFSRSLFSTRGFDAAATNDPVIPGAARTAWPPAKSFRLPGDSVSLVAETRQAAGLLSSGKIALPLPLIMARESTASRGIFVCKSRSWCGNGGGKSTAWRQGKRTMRE